MPGPKALNTCLFLSTLSVALLPAVPNAINSISMILWAVLMIVSAILMRKTQTTSRRSPLLFFLFGGNFIFLALSLLYSTDRSAGTQYLVTELPMLLFPFCIFFLDSPLKDQPGLIRKTTGTFWFATLIMTIWVFFSFYQRHLFAEFSNASSFNTVLRDTAEKITDKHSDYLSIFLAFSIFIAAERVFTSPRIGFKIMYACSIPVFGYLLLLLAARSPILALAIAAIVVVFLQIKKIMVRWLVLVGMLTAFVLAIRFTPSIYSRFQETRHTSLSTPVGLEFNSTNIRVGIFHCTKEIIGKNIFFGIGAGSDRAALNACYAQFPTTAYQITYYNTHNQYANLWLLTGIFSLLLFLASIVYAYTRALKTKDRTLLFFLILMTISFLTENVLSRQAGIVFYYLFLCLMMARPAAVNSSTPVPGWRATMP